VTCEHCFEVKIISSVGTISRMYGAEQSPHDVLAAIANCYAELRSMPAYTAAGVLRKVLVLPLAKHTKRPRARAVSFTNLCGRVHHPGAAHTLADIYHAGVLPVVQRIENAFGSVAHLYTDAGNLCTCHNAQYTLVRGARCSRAVARMLSTAMLPSAVARVTVHMLVASARIAHHVDTKTDMVLQFLRTMFHNVALSECVSEGSDRVKAVLLRNPLAIVCATYRCGMVHKVLLSIGQKGSINFFFSFKDGALMDAGFEDSLRALCETITAGVAANT
jgi:hypothetical protein